MNPHQRCKTDSAAAAACRIRLFADVSPYRPRLTDSRAAVFSLRHLDLIGAQRRKAAAARLS